MENLSLTCPIYMLAPFGMKPITGTMVDSLLFSASLLGILLLFSTLIFLKFLFII